MKKERQKKVQGIGGALLLIACVVFYFVMPEILYSNEKEPYTVSPIETPTPSEEPYPREEEVLSRIEKAGYEIFETQIEHVYAVKSGKNEASRMYELSFSYLDGYATSFTFMMPPLSVTPSSITPQRAEAGREENEEEEDFLEIEMMFGGVGVEELAWREEDIDKIPHAIIDAMTYPDVLPYGEKLLFVDLIKKASEDEESMSYDGYDFAVYTIEDGSIVFSLILP